MAQFARPSSDLLIDNYTTQVGGATNLYQTIDEVAPDDADFVQTQLTPTNDVYVWKLQTLEDPISSINHFFRYRYGKSASGGAQVDQTVQLRQGYVNEGSPGTLIAQYVHTDVAVYPVAVQQTLTGPQADSITDYTDLSGRVSTNQL